VVVPARHDGPQREAGDRRRLTGPDRTTEIESIAGGGLDVALASLPDLGWFPAAIADQGRPDLDRAVLLSRRDSFLRAALEQLG
jgi:hypothetical protein